MSGDYWINSDRHYPDGPIACGLCDGEDFRQKNQHDFHQQGSLNISKECKSYYGEHGCMPFSNGYASFLWIVFYIIWASFFVFVFYWEFMIRKPIAKGFVSKRIGSSSGIDGNNNDVAGDGPSKTVSKLSFIRKSKSFGEYVANDEVDEQQKKQQHYQSEGAGGGAEEEKDRKKKEEQLQQSERRNTFDKLQSGFLKTDTADKMTITCYKSTKYEKIGVNFIIFNSCMLIFYMFVILADYYHGCQLRNIDNFCFYGSFVIFGTEAENEIAMIIIWVVSVVWFLVIITGYDRIRNRLRLPSSPAEATHVRVWVEDEYEELSATPTRLMKIGRSIESWFERKILGKTHPGHSQTVPVKTCELPSSQGMRYFEFECARYTLPTSIANSVPTRIRAVALGGNPTLGAVYRHTYKDHQRGLGLEESLEIRDMVGSNDIPFYMPTLGEATREEFFTVFYLYQFASYVVWVWFAYWFVGIWLVFIVLLSAGTNIYLRMRNLKKVLSLTKHHENINVLRGGEWINVDTRDLVPGDLVQVAHSSLSPLGEGGWKVPADLILVQGSCAADESGLTGESMPVAKRAIDKRDADIVFDYLDKRCIKHVLFAGTVVLETSAPEKGGDVIAMVMATGIDTSRGELISAILFPARMRFQYDEEFPIALLFLVIYAMLSFALSIYFMSQAGQTSTFVTRWTYSMYTISEIISPLLKISLTVGQIKASERLSKQSVLCINPPRIAISGKVRVFCFDKTGTLTKEGLDFVGTQSIDTKERKLLHLQKDAFPQNIEHVLACCHGVTCYHGKYLGNAVEVSMFQAVGWSLTPDNQSAISPNGTNSLKIVRRFEFDHARMTMSVVVASSFEQGRLISFCKGAPEKIASICDPKTVPSDFLEQAQAHAMDGCYVLGLARSKKELDVSRLKKAISSASSSIEDFNRDEIEHDLECVGLLLFRNELKGDTTAAIEELKNGAVRPVMVTGDNAACGQYIARASGMIPRSTSLLLGEYDPIQNTVQWKLMKSARSSQAGDQQTLADKEMTTNDVIDYLQSQKFGVELVVNGKAFDILNDHGSIRQLLPYVRIYSRMSPHNKIRVVKLYMEEGLVVGMCGDGGNDVGALRTAHVGIALSQAEASVVSPFTSRTKSVKSAVDLLREGRASLANSFAGYKFLIQYGLLFSMAELMSYQYGVSMSIAQYLTMDLLAVVSLGYAMTLCEPQRVLGRKQPTSSLLGLHTVSSIIGTFIISLITLMINFSMMKSSKNYSKWPSHLSDGADWWTNSDAWETTTIFFTIFFCFVTAAFVFSFGGPFRRNVLTNYVLMFWVILFYVIGSALLLSEPNDFTRLYHMASEAFNTFNTTSPVWVLYQKNGGYPSPGMELPLRIGIWLTTFFIGVIGIMLWDQYFVYGWIGTKVANRFQADEMDYHDALKWAGIPNFLDEGHREQIP